MKKLISLWVELTFHAAYASEFGSFILYSWHLVLKVIFYLKMPEIDQMYVYAIQG